MRRATIPAVFLAASSLLLASSLQAQLGVPVSSPFLVNSNAASDAGEDRVTHLLAAGDTWIAVWHTTEDLGGTVGTDLDVFVARSTDRGQTWSPPQPLNLNAGTDSGTDVSPELATDGTGTWVAVWESNDSLDGTIGTDVDILLARSVDDGVTWSAPVPLNVTADTDSGGDVHPHIVTDGRGRWMCLFDSFETFGLYGTDRDIFVSTSTDAGVTWSFPAVVNSNAAGDTRSDRHPEPDYGFGAWVVVWDSHLPTGSDTFGSDRDVFFSRSTDFGATWSPVAPVHSNATLDFGEDREPKIATDGRGVWLALWGSTDALGGSVGTDRDLVFCRSTDNGVSWSPPAPLNTTAGTDGGTDVVPNVATDGRGNWVTVWQSDDTFGGTVGTDLDVFAARSTDGGVTWTDPQLINEHGATDTGADGSPNVTADGRDHWMVAWITEDSLGGTIGTDRDLLGAGFLLAPYPGTEDDLIMSTGIGGQPDGVDRKTGVQVDDLVVIETLSPGGTLAGQIIFVLAEVFTNGTPPAPRLPGIAVSGDISTTSVIYGGAPAPPFGEIPVLPAPGLRLAYRQPVQAVGAGLSVLFQGIVFAPLPLAANGIFAATHGHEVTDGP